MQTILGAGGAIGLELAKELRQHYTNKVRLVGRNPQAVNADDELFIADLTQPEQVKQAVAGSEVVYLTAGFEYSLKVWKATWPVVMTNVIEACKEHGAKLVFFDNVYMYDPSAIPHMTEDAPMNPISEKGKVRMQLVQQLLDEVKASKLTALIARAADFYGPNIKTSVLLETVYKNLQQGKSAFVLVDDSKIHSYTYTPDAAKATALLGNTPDAYNQVWHLPTAKNPLTGKQWVELFAEKLGKKPKYSIMPKWLVVIVGWFVPFMRELPEMLYQYNQNYVFDSSKFERRFNHFRVTSYVEGVEQIIKSA
ncbi:MAG: NAD-dependent epimerase/dehydratase family protein [Spirosomataceae bacterium]